MARVISYHFWCIINAFPEFFDIRKILGKIFIKLCRIKQKTFEYDHHSEYARELGLSKVPLQNSSSYKYKSKDTNRKRHNTYDIEYSKQSFINLTIRI